MRFALTDFFQDGIFRVFSFMRMPRTEENGHYWVRVDLGLARQHGISLQDLPLLCRTALETSVTWRDEHRITYTAEEMMLHAAKRTAAEEARARKSPNHTRKLFGRR
jgi:hypothetical protein